MLRLAAWPAAQIPTVSAGHALAGTGTNLRLTFLLDYFRGPVTASHDQSAIFRTSSERSKRRGRRSRRPSSPSTRAPLRGSVSSTCLRCLRSSRPTFDASVRWRVSARPRQRASTRAVSPASTRSRCVFSEIRVSVQRTSPSVSRSVGHPSIECSARRQRLPGPRNRSTLARSLSFPACGERSPPGRFSSPAS